MAITLYLKQSDPDCLLEYGDEPLGRFGGYRSDGDAGLVKVGCRDYDPEVGRFTTRDTDLSQKAYVYCDGDPVNAVDPDGHLLMRSILTVTYQHGLRLQSGL